MDNKPPLESIEIPQEQYRGRLVRIATQRMRFSDGTEKTFEFAERPPGVRILVTDGKNILLTKEWRSENQSWDYRLPGGKVFDTLDEYLLYKEMSSTDLRQLSLLAAQKELKEETLLNLPLESFKYLHYSICGATIIWDLHYFLAEAPKQELEKFNITTSEGEQTHPRWFNYADAKSLCLKGDIQEDRTAAVLLRYLLLK